MRKLLKNEGFNFVGPTLVYAFMQAVGMLVDHLTSYFRYKEVASQSEAFASSILMGLVIPLLSLPEFLDFFYQLEDAHRCHQNR